MKNDRTRRRNAPSSSSVPPPPRRREKFNGKPREMRMQIAAACLLNFMRLRAPVFAAEKMKCGRRRNTFRTGERPRCEPSTRGDLVRVRVALNPFYTISSAREVAIKSFTGEIFQSASAERLSVFRVYRKNASCNL